jgi:hypothetical protein
VNNMQVEMEIILCFKKLTTQRTEAWSFGTAVMN